MDVWSWVVDFLAMVEMKKCFVHVQHKRQFGIDLSLFTLSRLKISIIGAASTLIGILEIIIILGGCALTTVANSLKRFLG